MPHKFEAHPDHPAVAYLVRLHADLGGRIQVAKAQAEQLASEMRHVEAVIRMFDPDYNVAGIATRRRQRTNPWFKRGTLFREALGVLRMAAAPMTVREMTDAVLAAKGIATADKRQRLGIEAGIRCALEDHAGKSVERAGEGSPKRWRLLG
jgi:hypothetical protein